MQQMIQIQIFAFISLFFSPHYNNSFNGNMLLLLFLLSNACGYIDYPRVNSSVCVCLFQETLTIGPNLTLNSC